MPPNMAPGQPPVMNQVTPAHTGIMTMDGNLNSPLPLSPSRDSGEESVALGPLPEDEVVDRDFRDCPGFFPRFDFFFPIRHLQRGCYLRSAGIPKG